MEVLTVKCTNPKNYALTLNKEYNAIENGNYYLVTNDNNKNQRYYKTLFEEQEEVEIPESTYSFVSNFLYIDDQTFHLNINLDDSKISCGIKEYYNLNSLFKFVNKVDFNLTEITKKIILKSALGIIWGSNEQNILLLSTNTNNFENEDKNEYYELQNSILSEVFEGKITKFEEIYNPNSDNYITLWVIVQN